MNASLLTSCSYLLISRSFPDCGFYQIFPTALSIYQLLYEGNFSSYCNFYNSIILFKSSTYVVSNGFVL